MKVFKSLFIVFFSVATTLKPVSSTKKSQQSSRKTFHVISKALSEGTDKILFGLMDNTGKVVLEPKYKSVKYLGHGLIAISTNDDLFKIVDTAKSIVSKYEYTDVYPFRNGMCRIERNEKWGFLDSRGIEIVKPKFEFATNFSDGLAIVTFGNRYGYIDTSGALGINPNFKYKVDHPSLRESKLRNFLFHNSLAIFEINNKYGFVNKKGTVVIEPTFDFASNFTKYETAIVGLKLNSIPDRLTKTTQFSASIGNLLSSNHMEYWFIDKKGSTLTKNRFCRIGEITDEYIAAISIEKFTKAQWISYYNSLSSSTKPTVESLKKRILKSERLDPESVLKDPNNSLYCKIGKLGFVSPNGEWKLKPIYLFNSIYEINFTFFSENLASVSSGILKLNAETNSLERQYRYGFINKKGNFLIKDQFYPLDGFNEGLSPVSINKPSIIIMPEADKQYVGFINKQGKFVISPVYESASSFYNGVASVRGHNDCLFKGSCYIDKRGNYLYYDQGAVKK